ncbi:MAG: RHS repeat-associated core domain-containing protein, partial [Myxococcota bacterium]
LYLRARHYDPATGRFLQADPLGLGSDQLYAYAANNPYRYRDPFGLKPQAPDPCAAYGCLSRPQVPDFRTYLSSFGSLGPANYLQALATHQADQGDLVMEWDTVHGAQASASYYASSFALGALAELLDPRELPKNLALAAFPWARARPALTGIGAARGAPMRVLYFTDDVGVEAITKSGSLRQGTFVTLPRDVPAGSTSRQVEELLEIAPGRGGNYIDRFVDPGDLMIPGPEHGGAFTSGGARQFQLLRELEIDPTRFGRTGP